MSTHESQEPEQTFLEQVESAEAFLRYTPTDDLLGMQIVEDRYRDIIRGLAIAVDSLRAASSQPSAREEGEMGVKAGQAGGGSLLQT